jgi:PDZ domain
MKLRLSLLALLLSSALANAATPPATEIEKLRAENAALKAELDAQKKQLDGIILRRIDAAPIVQLGFMVGTKEGRTSLLYVRPGSPAEKAGLRQGDTLLTLNGQAINASNPMGAVFEMLRPVKPGDSVGVGVERDGKPLTLTAIAEARDVRAFRGLSLDGIGIDRAGIEAAVRKALEGIDVNAMVKSPVIVDGKALSTMSPGEVDVIVREALNAAKGSLGNLEIDKIVANALDGAATSGNVTVLGAHGERALGNARVMMLRHGGQLGLDLASLNPELGRYFGTTSGALLLTDPTDSNSPLRAGDVIQEINGTRVNTPQDVWKALREHVSKPIAMAVFRDRRKIALTLPAAASQ